MFDHLLLTKPITMPQSKFDCVGFTRAGLDLYTREARRRNPRTITQAATFLLIECVQLADEEGYFKLSEDERERIADKYQLQVSTINHRLGSLITAGFISPSAQNTYRIDWSLVKRM